MQAFAGGALLAMLADTLLPEGRLFRSRTRPPRCKGCMRSYPLMDQLTELLPPALPLWPKRAFAAAVYGAV